MAFKIKGKKVLYDKSEKKPELMIENIKSKFSIKDLVRNLNK